MQEKTDPVVETLAIATGDRVSHQISRHAKENSHIVGCHSVTALAPLLCGAADHPLRAKPNIIVVENEELAIQLSEELQFFNPDIQCHVLPPYDVNPYSNLYPNPRTISQRLHWLIQCDQARPGQVFIASIAALLQKTLPYSQLKEFSFNVTCGQNLPDQFHLKLDRLGYMQVPVVEDPGTYSLRGGIIDIFSPASLNPHRVELFADEIEKIKVFDPDNQRSVQEVSSLIVSPAREVLFTDSNRQKVALGYKETLRERNVDPAESHEILNNISKGNYFHGIEFLLPYFYDNLELPLDHFSCPTNFWLYSPSDVARQYDHYYSALKEEFERSEELCLRVSYDKLFAKFDELAAPIDSKILKVENISVIEGEGHPPELEVPYKSYSLEEFRNNCQAKSHNRQDLAAYLKEKLTGWRAQGYRFFIATPSLHQIDKLRSLFELAGFTSEIIDENNYPWLTAIEAQEKNLNLLHIVGRPIAKSFRLSDENLIFFRDEDFYGLKKIRRHKSQTDQEAKSAFIANFNDLKAGDLIVHKQHGVGVFEGLKVMPINAVDTEFVQIAYKDRDKLYLPVYRINQIQKFSGPQNNRIIDKLGGSGWDKTKKKVKKHLRDMAADLLKLYAKRAEVTRPPFSFPDNDFLQFETAFKFEETLDQDKAISDVISDMTSEHPMDRLVCGDVGFGKTEVAMRAAFKAVQDGKQVVLIAPTTILSFQHKENFLKRFKGWPIDIRAFNRFVNKKELKQNVVDLADGKVDIAIGTHRLLSKDIEFKNLGLLIIDEEQKFGVKHKEKVRHFRHSIDTLTLSATPIPRTLNMSLVGIRDLSLINTAPIDRLPTRTFVCKFDKETIRKAIASEVSRGGQVFFIHNRVHSIESVASELREILPDYRIAIGHGQMPEDQLEKTVLSFFNKEIDILLCTTIIESGMDIPNANTMFVDNAHAFGLSQLYQLRGRVGRSKERAYCYLIVPASKKVDKEAQERLRIIQENTALGSGIRIAQHDLELRGTGDFLGQEQSGHINAIGYEMYMELLEQAVAEQKGEALPDDDLDPEINLRIPALIPDNYIPDIRLRLSYYKALSRIGSESDINRLEDEIRDQFGKLPEPVLNLMGIMLIRKFCKDLGVKDLSQTKSGISLSLTPQTPMTPEKAIELSGRTNKKYSLTPDSRLVVRIKEVSWPRVYEELDYLLNFAK